ncbi:regenerating islet-derived protein 3-gamma-like isoform X1 [Acomys russatus]|uniref:regenerating islet-derived protein 3-gamma-like isoform X1 n=1 Tax=Acomys russatus TaxID=60746 RepID=UPI0021E32824|nr:regenerating islet-derived protein 3-gamma-like isoform X1 [Acomys russatus]
MLARMALTSMSWMLLSCLMLLSQVQGEDVKDKVPSSRISCPKGSRAFGSHCYALFRIAKNWFDADLACQKRPEGHLVSVLNGGEASFLASLVKSSANNGQNVWIGLHDPTLGQQPNRDGWVWSNADIMDYFNWEQNPSSASGGYCGSLSRGSGYLEWSDTSCAMVLPYVCKFNP